MRLALGQTGQNVVMPILWINEFGMIEPVWGSFAVREASVAAGRAPGPEARTIHVIRDEDGAVIEASSYRAASCLTRRSEILRASPTVVRPSPRSMSSRT
jgi:hypothetical protein